MTGESDVSWWEDYNNGVQILLETGGEPDLPVISSEICELLDSVDAAFAIVGADTPGWSNPYSECRDPDSQSYERVTNPGRFLIAMARAQAWSEVLLSRDWAQESAQIDWALGPFEDGGFSTALRPAAAGAVPLVMTTHNPVDNAHVATLTLAAGDPAVMLASLPDCGCDGCDSGSAELLKEIDQWILSVIDGSLQVDLDVDRIWIRTSFGSQGNTVQSCDRPTRPTAFTAGPWSPSGKARALVPAIETRLQ